MMAFAREYSEGADYTRLATNESFNEIFYERFVKEHEGEKPPPRQA